MHVRDEVVYRLAAEPQAVEPEQPILGPSPQETSAILHDVAQRKIGKSLGFSINAELLLLRDSGGTQNHHRA